MEEKGSNKFGNEMSGIDQINHEKVGGKFKIFIADKTVKKGRECNKTEIHGERIVFGDLGKPIVNGICERKIFTSNPRKEGLNSSGNVGRNYGWSWGNGGDVIREKRVN
jgi:hypothetical protein